jgi:hypothetical protein
MSSSWKGAVPLFEVTIEQLGDFAGSAGFLNFVQRARNVLTETATRIRNLLHRGKRNFRGNRFCGIIKKNAKKVKAVTLVML